MKLYTSTPAAFQSRRSGASRWLAMYLAAARACVTSQAAQRAGPGSDRYCVRPMRRLHAHRHARSGGRAPGGGGERGRAHPCE